MGRRAELDKDLSEYLSGRRRKKIDVIGMIKGIMPKSTPPPVKLPPEIQAYDTDEPAVEEKPTVEIFEDEKQEDTKQAGEKKSIWKSVLGKLGIKNSGNAAEDSELSESGQEEKIKEMVEKELLMQDMKSLAKITLFAIKQLPPERLAEFKQSTDFTDLKELLKKYKFIK